MNACASSGAFAKVTKILDQNKEYFPKAELPLDLRRLNLHAKDMKGDLPDALIEAKQLAQSTQDIQDHLGYTDLLMKQGNIKEVAKAVRYMSANQKLPPQHALRFSKIFSSDNPDLAKSLLKKAAASELTTSEKAAAYFLGLQLGISDELVPHLSQFIPGLAKGSVPGVQVKSVDDLVDFMAENQRHAEYLEKMYFEGKAPIHTIVERSNKSLAALYHNNTGINEHAGTLSPSAYPLFARHGGRGIPKSFPNAIQDWNLAMDVTALLLSTHLGLLNTIEENFKPIHISPETMYLLHKMKADVSSMQPDRIVAARGVIKSYRADKIYLVDGFINEEDPGFKVWREEKNAKYLTWSQTVRGEISSSGVSINCKQVLDLLLRNGAVSKIDYEKFLEILGAEGEDLSGTFPTDEDVRSIYCENGVLIEIARSGFMEQLTSELDVYISSEFLASCENSVEADESGTNFAGWIGTLRDRISQGIELGQYKVLPSIEYGEVQAHELESASLKSLLLIPKEEQYIVWIDDRMVNGHLTAGSHSIACCHDILKALLNYDKISLDEYFEFLMKLRRGNVRFVPIEEDEILYQLSQAPEKDGEIRETPQLRILRQYLAGCYIENSGFLKGEDGSNSPKPDGELPFMLQHHQAVSAAVLAIWKGTEKTIDRKISESKWIVDSIFFEQVSIFPAWVQTESDHRKLVSVRLAGFLTNAIQLVDGKSKDSTCLKKDYLDWVWLYILERRLKSEPSLLPVLSDTLAGFLCSVFLSIEKEEAAIDLSDPEMLSVKAELRRNIRLYPDPLRKALFAEKRIKEILKDDEASEHLISIGEYYFKVEHFNDVLSQAVLGSDVNIKTWDDEYEFVVSHEKQNEVENVSFLFNCSGSNERSFRLLSVENSAFLPTVTERVESVLPRFMSFDLSQNDLRGMLEVKMNEEDVNSRVSFIRDLIDRSMVSYYDDLANDLAKNNRFSFSELIPRNCENLFHYFKFGASISIPDGLGESAKRLIDDYGILTALCRLGGVPCEMPQQVLTCLDDLDDGEKLALFSDWKKKVFTPLSLCHFVRLASKYDIPELNNIVVEMYESYLTGPDLEIINSTFLSILRWVRCEFEQRKELSGYSHEVVLILTWLHADKIFSIFMSTGKPDEKFRNYFQKRQRPLLIDHYLGGARKVSDIAEPELLPTKYFVMQCVGFMFEDRGHALTKEAVSVLESQSCTKLDGEKGRALELMRDVSLCENCLDTFLVQDVYTILERVGAGSWSKVYRKDTLQELLDSKIENIDELSLTLMHIMVTYSHYLLPEDVYKKYRSFILETDFLDICKSDHMLAFTLIGYSVEVLVRRRDGQVLNHIKNQIIGCAKWLVNCKALDGKALDDGLAHLVGSIVSIPFQVDTRIEFAKELVGVLKEMVDKVPKSLNLAKVVMKNIYYELSLEEGREVTAFITYLRAS